MKIYCISGFGADETVFYKIKFPKGFEIRHLSYTAQIHGESLRDYALRMAKNIDTSQSFALLGLSMGGMIAVEIAKEYKPETLILLSSAATASELPARYKFMGKWNLQNIAPISVMKNASILKKFFYRYEKADRDILIKAIRKTEPTFIRWGMQAILDWKNDSQPENYFHIHGTSDNVLPIKNTHTTHVVEGGNHFMVLDRAADINIILEKILTSNGLKTK